MKRIVAIFRRSVVTRMHWTVQLALAFAAVALATVSRWLLDKGENGVPFASYFPFIILAAIVLELRFAVLVAVGSLVAVWTVFLDWGDPNPARAGLGLAYLITSSLMIFVGQVLRTTVRELNDKANEYELFNRELQHRARNALQIVGVMATRASQTGTPQEFFADLTGRIAALVRANDFLGVTAQKRGEVSVLVELALAPFERSAISISGPECEIGGNVGMRLMMVLHELGTNATKHGALSCSDGHVEIHWTVNDDRASLIWQERDGPPVSPPTRRGLGSRLLVAHAPLDHVEVRYIESGVVCSIVFPVLTTVA